MENNKLGKFAEKKGAGENHSTMTSPWGGGSKKGMEVKAGSGDRLMRREVNLKKTTGPSKRRRPQRDCKKIGMTTPTKTKGPLQSLNGLKEGGQRRREKMKGSGSSQRLQ